MNTAQENIAVIKIGVRNGEVYIYIYMAMLYIYTYIYHNTAFDNYKMIYSMIGMMLKYKNG